MRFIIKENLTKREKRKRDYPEQFIEKDFDDKEAAEKYAEVHCKGWKKIKIKEV